MCRFDNLMKYQHQVQQQIHKNVGTHDLRCTVCHGVFTSRADLDGHMLTHTQQKMTSSNSMPNKVRFFCISTFFFLSFFFFFFFFFFGIKARLFHLLDYVSCQSEKLGFQKKKQGFCLTPQQNCLFLVSSEITKKIIILELSLRFDKLCKNCDKWDPCPIFV